MNYVDVLLLIESRGEKTLAQDTRAVITNVHRYTRGLDTDEGAWMEDMEPGAPEKKMGRGGAYYVWKREEAADDKPLVLPEGT